MTTEHRQSQSQRIDGITHQPCVVGGDFVDPAAVGRVVFSGCPSFGREKEFNVTIEAEFAGGGGDFDALE